MRYLIIGLGIYGSNLAIDLTRMGHEVIGADKNPSLVEAIKDRISTAYIIDSTDEASLGVLPLKNVDLVIVAIGENFGASVRTVAILKKIGVPHIYARAIDELHQAILEGFEVDRIITPEQRAATDLVNEMTFGIGTSALRVDDTTSIVRFKAPPFLLGMHYSDLNLDTRHNIRLIAACRATSSRNILGVTRSESQTMDPETLTDSRIEEGDILVCMGSKSSFQELFHRYNQA